MSIESRKPVSKEVAEAIDVIASGKVAYARYNPSFLGAYITVYRKEAASPSGIMLIRGFKAAVWEEAIKVSGADIQLMGPR